MYRIIVVDNHSNERNHKKLQKLENEKIKILWLDDNYGGAGGFEKGMRYAAEQYRPDWYWIMDDDAYPRPDTLEQLMRHANLENVGCIAPLIWGVDWKEYQLYHHKKTNRLYTKDTAKFTDVVSIRDVEEVNANAYVGPLFPKHVVEEVGYPDGGLFIYGDDTEYTVRVGQKYKVYLIRAAVIEHNDPPASITGFDPTTYWKFYYTVRNRILLAKKYNRGGAKIQALLYLTGNVLWQLAYSVVRKGLGKARFRRMKCVLQGYVDGLREKKGKTIDPVDYQGK